ncbi:DUF423 domain-containing protein [Sansalvadorimonas sp. 2012CJ34-2]|uniref:DUF423 domain-containing protein n=1 Tax=Parendozoicomonas callyspongiae TaxID=2942213 RepID=A0ABT0PCW8_9GAMM|nr:DUF423 domain-containing protein [Sansalvadorimonas sp. 2012CJ34-2]MCL6268378.1 DUF423 domain-containing protein [Sansalvadorimonas sp. 2012CJ34-2]
MSRFYLGVTAIFGFLAVALGAFGAHILAASLSPRMMEVWEKAVNYQMFHTIAIGLIAVFALHSPGKFLKYAARLFTAGTLLFSGSLYFLVVTGFSKLGMITPLGGVAFLSGWIMLFVHAMKFTRKN